MDKTKKNEQTRLSVHCVVIVWIDDLLFLVTPGARFAKVYASNHVKGWTQIMYLVSEKPVSKVAVDVDDEKADISHDVLSILSLMKERCSLKVWGRRSWSNSSVM